MSQNPALTQWLTQPGGLAARLRALRLRAGLSGKALADRLGWGPYKVSRLENGRQLPNRGEVECWVAACGGPEELDGLVALLGEAAGVRSSWRARLARGERDPHAAYDRLLDHTTQLAAVAVTMLPTLLQTGPYARSVLSAVREVDGTSPAEVERAVAAAVNRARVLGRRGRWYEFIVAEAVLRGAPCSPDDMVDQLDHLTEVAGLPNVVLRILPSRAGISVPPVNSFQVYDTDLVLVDTIVGQQEHHADHAAATYRRALLLLREASVVGEEANRAIEDAVRHHRAGAGWRTDVAV